MTLINPISQAALPLSGSSAESPAKNRPDLPVNRQNIPDDTRERESGAKPVTREMLQKTVKQLNKFAVNQQRNLNFRVDEELNITVVTVVNAETDEVIRQIPPQEVLALARHFGREMNAILDVMA